MTDHERTSPELLRVDQVDLTGLAEALDDGNPDVSWWFNPRNGEVRPEGDWSDGFDSDDLEYQGWVIVEAPRSRGAFEDMEIFADAVGDLRARDQLLLSLEGKGAFRRFRDTMRSFPELRDPWRTWSAARSDSRAVRWLIVGGHVDELGAEAALATLRRDGQSVLDEISGRSGASYPLAEAPASWASIVASIERGEAVNLTSDGVVVAIVSPYESPI